MPAEHTGRQGLPQQAFRNTKALEEPFFFYIRKTIVSETHSITFFPEGHAVSWKLPKNTQFGQFFFLLKVCVKRVGAYVIIS